MNKSTIEFKKWYQICLQSEESTARAKPGHELIPTSSGRLTIVKCGQFFSSVLAAGGFYLLNRWSGDGVWLLAALAASSAFVYIGLAMLSRTRAMALLNVMAMPFIFASAFAGMTAAGGWLAVSYILHGSVTAVQLSSVDEGLSGCLFFWSVFCSAMTLLLLLG